MHLGKSNVNWLYGNFNCETLLFCCGCLCTLLFHDGSKHYKRGLILLLDLTKCCLVRLSETLIAFSFNFDLISNTFPWTSYWARFTISGIGFVFVGSDFSVLYNISIFPRICFYLNVEVTTFWCSMQLNKVWLNHHFFISFFILGNYFVVHPLSYLLVYNDLRFSCNLSCVCQAWMLRNLLIMKSSGTICFNLSCLCYFH